MISKNTFGSGSPVGKFSALPGIEYIDIESRKKWKQTRIPFGSDWRIVSSDVSVSFNESEIKDAEVDFGDVPIPQKTFYVSDSSITSGSKIMVSKSLKSSGRLVDEIAVEQLEIGAEALNGGMNLHINCIVGNTTGKFHINYSILKQ